MKNAVILGATGLVGSELLKLVLDDPYFDKVVILVRRESGISHPKLKEEIVDFKNPERWNLKVQGHVLFSAMGTTLAKAGSKKAQYEVDYTYQYEVAKSAAENGIPEYVLVSAPGASPKSMIFYSRIKGELDRDVEKLPFRRIVLIKPSILSGNRDEERRGEELGIKIMNKMKKVPFVKKYRPIEGVTVARAMINAVKLNDNRRIREYELEEVFELASAEPA